MQLITCWLHSPSRLSDTCHLSYLTDTTDSEIPPPYSKPSSIIGVVYQILVAMLLSLYQDGLVHGTRAQEDINYMRKMIICSHRRNPGSFTHTHGTLAQITFGNSSARLE
jgi:hypothetical protein